MVPEQRRYPWRLFFLLLAAAIVGVVAALPYLSAMLASTFAAHPLPLPLPFLVLIQGVVNFSIATALGILAARQLGLGAPILEAWLYGKSSVPRRPILLSACVAGLVFGVVTLLVIISPIGDVLRHFTSVSESTLPLWKRLLACLYGGLSEEVLMRLFLLSVVLWLLTKLFRTVLTKSVIFWSANLLVAIAFGAAHLPFAASLSALTSPLIAIIVCLNGFVALGLGYLYWSRGLEAAMLAHFIVDLILHVLGPTFVKG